MRKTLWIIPLLFAAIVAPKASADSMVGCEPTTKTGGTLVLGDKNPLTDEAELGSFCPFKGTLTFTVMGPDIFEPKKIPFLDPATGKPAIIDGPGKFSVKGPIPDVTGEFKWFAIYTPLDPKDGGPFKSKAEIQEVKRKLAVPEPGTGALMLLGVGVLLVTRKRIGQGRSQAT
jgi:hypothetical protein